MLSLISEISVYRYILKIAMSRPQEGCTDQMEWWCRNCALLLDVVQPAVQKLLDIEIRPASLKDILFSNRRQIKNWATSKKLTDAHYKLLTSDCPSSSDFDLTLLNFVFYNIISDKTNNYIIHNSYKLLRFIGNIITIRNQLFHWIMDIDQAEILDELRKVWSRLCSIIQPDQLPSSEIIISQHVIEKYENKGFTTNLKYYKNVIQDMIQNELVENTKIINVITRLLEKFQTENSYMFKDNGLLTKTHHNRVREMHNLMKKLPEKICDMILENTAVQDITTALEKDYQHNQTLLSNIKTVLQNMENSLTFEENINKKVTETHEQVKVIKNEVLKLTQDSNKTQNTADGKILSTFIIFD